MKSTMTVLSTFALVFLTGCALPTEAELRADKPVLDEVTSKPLESLEVCIGNKLEASPPIEDSQLLSRPTADGYRISMTYSQGILFKTEIVPVVLVDMTKVANGIRVQLFTHFKFDPLGGALNGTRAIVSGCL